MAIVNEQVWVQQSIEEHRSDDRWLTDNSLILGPLPDVIPSSYIGWLHDLCTYLFELEGFLYSLPSDFVGRRSSVITDWFSVCPMV